jgi:hypothetical protein
MLNFRNAVAALAVLGLASCQYITGAKLRACDDPETLAVIESLIVRAAKVAYQVDVSHVDYGRLVRLEMLHPVKLEENISKYTCEGNIHIGEGSGPLSDFKINYTSQVVNNNLLVEVHGTESLALLVTQAMEPSTAATSPAEDAATMAGDAAADLAPAATETIPSEGPSVSETTDASEVADREARSAQACEALHLADGKPYKEAKSILMSNGFLPFSPDLVKGEYSTTVDGDPANCGNAGCDLAWFTHGSPVQPQVGVSIDDNIEQSEWIAHASSPNCK